MTLRNFGREEWFGSNLEFAIASRCKGIYRLLTDADGLAAVEELEVRFFFFGKTTEKLSCVARFET